MDILGPIDLQEFTEEGKYFLLIISDLHSRYTHVEGLEHISGKEVVRIIQSKWTEILGISESILTDNGAQFHSSEMKTFCETHNIKRLFYFIYNLTRNSVSERQNGVIVNMLRCCRG